MGHSNQQSKLRSSPLARTDQNPGSPCNHRVWRNLTHTFPHPYALADAEHWYCPSRTLTRVMYPSGSIEPCRAKPSEGSAPLRGTGISVATADFGYWLGESFWGRGLPHAADQLSGASGSVQALRAVQRRCSTWQSSFYAGAREGSSRASGVPAIASPKTASSTVSCTHTPPPNPSLVGTATGRHLARAPASVIIRRAGQAPSRRQPSAQTLGVDDQRLRPLRA